jgi:uncharacterized membrane protein SirB2
MHALLLRNVFLSLHIFSIVILSTAVVGGLVVHKLIWHAFDAAPDQLPLTARMSKLIGLCGAVGGPLLLLTGIGLLASTHFAYWGARWLSIKLVLYVVLALVGILGGKFTEGQLSALIPAQLARVGQGGGVSVAVDPRLPVLRQRMALFHVAHISLFAAIVLLAVFKP